MAANRLDELAQLAVAGDRRSLERLAAELKDDIYGLAMRMLSYPADAEDATQDILIKVITHLSQFRGESSFRTWAWSIATRHLMNFRKGSRESFVSFDLIENMIRAGDDAGPDTHDDAEAAILAEEVKIGCTGAMLVALDREHRIAYVLAEIFDLPGSEAARILSISPATFRKRLQRARDRLTGFLDSVCGLANPDRPCRCRRQIGVNLAHGVIDPAHLLFATHPARSSPIAAPRARLREAHEIENAAAIFRTHPSYAAPDKLEKGIRDLIASGRYRMFDA
ncbi:MAG: RNA polymerase sigma factor [Rhizobiaceae bacterium]